MDRVSAERIKALEAKLAQAEQALNYLMAYNKKAEQSAGEFIEWFEKEEIEGSEYWKGQEFHAGMNIRILQSFGISAKDKEE